MNKTAKTYDTAAEQYQAAGQERGDFEVAVATYENAYFQLFRFRAPRPESFTIPVKLDRETRPCTFTKSYESDYGTTNYASDTHYVVRYRTGNKLHERRPIVSLNAEEFIPESMDLKASRWARYGNNRSIETPVAWKDALPAYAEKRLAK